LTNMKTVTNMKNDKKARAAAMAAVMTYIKTGEEAARAMSLESRETGPPKVSSQALFQASPWGASGRQAQMNARFLMQIRALR
jgi:hypothetical protein